MVSPSNITGSNGKPFSVFGPNVRPTVGIDVKSTQDGLQCSTSGSSSVYTEAVVEIECSICAEIRPHTSFISTNGELRRVLVSARNIFFLALIVIIELYSFWSHDMLDS